MSGPPFFRLKLSEVLGNWSRTWEVFAPGGVRVGVLQRDHHWNGFTYTSARWSAGVNPTGEPFGCVANILDVRTKREALDWLYTAACDAGVLHARS